MEMAQLRSDWNFLGLEIRQPLVTQANDWRSDWNLTNLHYLFCNANNSLRPLLTSLPPRTLQQVTIQFPDPWFKRKHQKRRVVTETLVADLAAFLAQDGFVFLQSDVLEVAIEMRDRFAAHSGFTCQQEGWLAENPLPVSTERELVTLEYGESVYRSWFLRT